MAEPASPPPAQEPETHRGLVATLSGFAGSLGHHLQTLAALFGEETTEAAVHYLWLAATLIAALVFAVFGYVLLVLGAAFLLASFTGISWLWICLGLGILHFAAAGICAFIVKSRLFHPVFPATSVELKKDFEALKNFQP